MGLTEYKDIHSFFTEKDIEGFKECSQIVFNDIRFCEDDILAIAGKQDIKKVLSFLFRADKYVQKNFNSRDNWYAYIEDKTEVRFACLYDVMERDNAVLKTMRFIKRDTGFNVPYILLRFDLFFDVIDEAPRHLELDDGRTADFGLRVFQLSEKYMHFLGMQAGYWVSEAMKKLNMPECKSPAVSALITDSNEEYWSYYILISSTKFDISEWCPPDNYNFCIDCT